MIPEDNPVRHRRRETKGRFPFLPPQQKGTVGAEKPDSVPTPSAEWDGGSKKAGFRSCPRSNMGRWEQKSRIPFLPPQQNGTVWVPLAAKPLAIMQLWLLPARKSVQAKVTIKVPKPRDTPELSHIDFVAAKTPHDSAAPDSDCIAR